MLKPLLIIVTLILLFNLFIFLKLYKKYKNEIKYGKNQMLKINLYEDDSTKKIMCPNCGKETPLTEANMVDYENNLFECECGYIYDITGYDFTRVYYEQDRYN